MKKTKKKVTIKKKVIVKNPPSHKATARQGKKVVKVKTKKKIVSKKKITFRKKKQIIKEPVKFFKPAGPFMEMSDEEFAERLAGI